MFSTTDNYLVNLYTYYKHSFFQPFIYLENQSSLKTMHRGEISEIFLETVPVAFETTATVGAAHSLRELLLQHLFSQLQTAFGLQLVVEQQEGNYKDAWELDKGGIQEMETEHLTDDCEVAKGRYSSMVGKESDTFGQLDLQVDVLIVSCQQGLRLWQLVLQW